jgi:hypothetical protein
MKLKNYTSSIPPERSVALIEKKLVEVGADHIAKSYEKGKLCGIVFQVNNNDHPQAFKLPANVEAITKIMLEEIKKPHPGTRERVREQAERTAWKLLLDWVEVQVSMIVIGRREVIEVFLPYLYDFKKDQTLYQKLVLADFKLQIEDKRQ